VRTANRIASGVLGLVLIALGILVVIEMARVALDRSPLVLPLDRWYRSLTSNRIDDGAFLAVAILVGLVGLTLLVLELRPWAPDRVRTGSSPDAPWWVSRRSVERRTATAADEVGGVSHARSAVRGATDRWRLRLRAEGWPDQHGAVMEAVRSELARLNAPPDTTVNVSLRAPRRRVA
jgi:hypothetical protein